MKFTAGLAAGLLTVTAAATPVHAGSYFPMTVDNEGMSWVDFASIKREGDIAKAWLLSVQFRTSYLAGHAYDFGQTLMQIDCVRDQYRVVVVNNFLLPQIALPSAENPSAKMTDITPDTLMSGLERYACHPEAKPIRTLDETAPKIVEVARSLKASGDLKEFIDSAGR